MGGAAFDHLKTLGPLFSDIRDQAEIPQRAAVGKFGDGSHCGVTTCCKLQQGGQRCLRGPERHAVVILRPYWGTESMGTLSSEESQCIAWFSRLLPKTFWKVGIRK